MKKKMPGKKHKLFQDEISNEKEKNDLEKQIDFNYDFSFTEKASNIDKSNFEFINIKLENDFQLEDLISKRKPLRDKSLFYDFFKELSEQKDPKKVEESKIENSNIQAPIMNSPTKNLNFNLKEKKPNIFNFNKEFNGINFSKDENKIDNNQFCNTNSLTQNDFNPFFKKGNAFSNKSTDINSNINNSKKINNIDSSENNIIDFPGEENSNNINIIFNNDNNINNINYIEEEDFNPHLDINKVLSLEDKRSTIMIKNIPNKFTREKLLDLINKNFRGTYDLFIMPKDGKKNRNFGYAFVNFISSYSLPYFYFMFNGKKWIGTNSKKICEITYSKVQGRNELISHYPNKVIFFNEIHNMKTGNKFFIPKNYLMLFKQLFPSHPIEENSFGFFTTIPFIF